MLLAKKVRYQLLEQSLLEAASHELANPICHFIQPCQETGLDLVVAVVGVVDLTEHLKFSVGKVAEEALGCVVNSVEFVEVKQIGATGVGSTDDSAQTRIVCFDVGDPFFLFEKLVSAGV